MDNLTKLFGKVRPQIFLALSILGVIAYVGVQQNMTEVTVGCLAGIIALAKDVLQSDA
tara:strand:- start:443 stop:616 length:174 start_codon:yes stop_codon:yes gene_type:complete